MNVQLTADQHHAIDQMEGLLQRYYRKHNPSYLARDARTQGAARMSATATAKHEADGWRGLITDAEGHVLTRTVNLYATSDKAIDGANRLWAFKQQRYAADPAGGAL
ncbi:hypothetical protein PY254_10505 [Rhodanobacter sp. AS-Z3]|uniref:hypothetical protein n=1 Tax=Rhodanobacter sp. AS-Z3 TaxID=3031330 RepID=UPI00247A1A2A|nr:hypothetical protein [Rhodanobacter sp. AS-Z3]WEN13677.1 hypothetical protein PY254_10505 [Rhodanobacter sp. AS-Z3]